MLKFFRKYNKYILTVGVTLLMITFLIQPTLSMFRPTVADTTIGTIGEQELTLDDQRAAKNDLDALEAIAPVLAQLSASRDSTQWMLMLRDAQAMGINASNAEIDAMLLGMNIDDKQLAQLARKIGVSQDTARRAIGHWLIVQQYVELVYGLAHLPLSGDGSTPSRLGFYAAAANLIQQGRIPQAIMELESSKGAARISDPLRQHFLQDLYATATITAVPVDAGRYQPQPPTRDSIEALFNQYKDQFPGQSQPYGFGYRIADKVKIEYLRIPFQKVRDSVSVEEADALSYYQEHPEEFKVTQPTSDTPAATADIRPYDAVRRQIIDQLKSKAAESLIARITKTAQALMLEDSKKWTETDGYKNLPPDWQPVPLTQVAAQLQQQFSVLPDVIRRDDQWMTAEDLASLPDIGDSAARGEKNYIPFADYAFTCRELRQGQPTLPTHPSLHLQARLPSATLESIDQTRYIFRLFDIAPGRVPDSVDEALDQATRDAARLAAYQQLKTDSETWLNRARTEKLDALAAELGAPVLTPQPFTKRTLGYQANLELTDIPNIGKSEPFIQQVFALAEKLPLDTDLKQTPDPERTLAIPVDGKQQLFLVQLRDYHPMTQEQYSGIVRLIRSGTLINQATLHDQHPPNPVSVEELSLRLDYHPTHESKSNDQEPIPD
jgi:hypothetical protein